MADGEFSFAFSFCILADVLLLAFAFLKSRLVTFTRRQALSLSKF